MMMKRACIALLFAHVAMAAVQFSDLMVCPCSACSNRAGLPAAGAHSVGHGEYSLMHLYWQRAATSVATFGEGLCHTSKNGNFRDVVERGKLPQTPGFGPEAW